MKKQIVNLWSWQASFRNHQNRLQKMVNAPPIVRSASSAAKVVRPPPDQWELQRSNRGLAERIIRLQLKKSLRGLPPSFSNFKARQARRREKLQKVSEQNQKMFERILTAKPTVPKPARLQLKLGKQLTLLNNSRGKVLPTRKDVDDLDFECSKVLSQGKHCHLHIKSSNGMVKIYAFCQLDQNNEFAEKFKTSVPIVQFSQLLHSKFEGSIVKLVNAIDLDQNNQLVIRLAAAPAASLEVSKPITAKTSASLNIRNRHQGNQMPVLQEEPERATRRVFRKKVAPGSQAKQLLAKLSSKMREAEKEQQLLERLQEPMLTSLQASAESESESGSEFGSWIFD